jgi:hypothetical protein
MPECLFDAAGRRRSPAKLLRAGPAGVETDYGLTRPGASLRTECR